jgi:hypothetical protein
VEADMADLNARVLLSCALALAGTALPGVAAAALTTFTDRSAFDAALTSLPGVIKQTTEGYDTYSSGSTIADGTSLAGLSYTYGSSGNDLAGSGASLQVSSGYGTTSPANYLGTSDGGIFQSGDDFTLSFGPAKAVGLYFISNDVLFDGDITLTTGAATASLVVADEQAFGLSDGRVYFLGLVDDTGSFSSAEIRSFCLPCGSFLFNIDDVITARAPVPATLPLVLTALGLAGLQRSRKPPRSG